MAPDLETLSTKRRIRGDGDRNGNCTARRVRNEGNVHFLAHIPTAPKARRPVRLLLQQRHVQVAAGAPTRSPRRTLASRSRALGRFSRRRTPRPHGCACGSPCSGARLRCRYRSPPVLAEKPGVRQRLGVALPDDLGGLVQHGRPELREHLERLGLGCLTRLHGMDCLEHGRDLRISRLRHLRQHVPVEADRAAPVGGLREHLGGRAGHAGCLVAGEHADAAQPARLEPREELAPALRRLGEPLGGADDLVVPVVVDAYCHHHGDVLVGASPQPLEAYPVDVWT